MADRSVQPPGGLSQIIADYVRRVDAGEQIDRQTFLAEHPEWKSELERYLDEKTPPEQQDDPNESRAVRTVSESAHINSVPAASSPSVDGLAEEFGRYRIEKPLGAGAMGTVYLAHDTELDRKVALKVPKFDNDDAEMMERFYREARSAAKIQHRHICPVFDVGEINGARYISMAYIEGRTLKDYINPDKPQTDRQVALLVRKLTLALAEAHSHSVIHRDLKPSNIMIDRKGEPVIMDFGLARQIDDEMQSRLTQTGTIMGTPIYMSPEQVDGDIRRIGPASDVYSLGIIFYELLVGRPPFQGSLTAVLAQIVTKEPDLPSKFCSNLHPRLEAICLKMIAKQIPDRYQSMNEAAQAITRFLRQPQTAAAPKDAKIASTLADTPPEQLTGHESKVRFRGKRSLAGKRYQEGPWGLFSSRLALILTVAFVGILGLALAGVTIYVQTGKGTVQITVHDEKARLSLDGETIKIGNLGKPLTVRATNHELIVERDGLEAKTKRFTLKRGETLALDVTIVNGNLAILTADKNHPPGKSVAGKSVADTKPPTSESSDPPAASPTKLERVVPPQAGSVSFPRTPLPDGSPGEVKRLAGHVSPVEGVAFSPDGRTVVSGSVDRTVRIWDVVSGRQLRRLTGHTAVVHGVAFSPDGRLVASAGHDKTVRIWDAQTGRTLRTFENIPGKGVYHVVFSPDGKQLAAVSMLAPARIWNVETGRLIPALNQQSTTVHSLAFSPDGKWLVTSGARTDIQIRDAKTGRTLRTLHTSPSETRGLVFSPDGTQLAAGNWGKSASIWNFKSGRLAHALTGFTDGVIPRSFTPDGRFLLTSNDDKTIRLWDTQTGAEVHRFTADTHVMAHAALSPDGRFVVSGGGIYRDGKDIKFDRDSALRIWRLPKKLWPQGRGNSPRTGSTQLGSVSERQAAEWVLKNGGVMIVAVGNKKIGWVKTAINLPHENFQIKTIGLSRTQITDTGLAHLEGRTNLRDLWLNDTQVTDAGLAHLKGLINLNILWLTNTKITDAGLVHLKGLANLQRLSLHGTKITGAGLAYLKGLAILQTLWLNATQITDAGLVHLKGLASLRDLGLYGTQITDAGLAHLKGLTNLRLLDLRGTKITDAGLAHLEGLRSLQTLDLRGTQVTAAGVAALKKVLSNCKITGPR